MKRSRLLSSCMVLFVFFAIISLAACDSSSDGGGGGSKKAADLNEQSLDRSMKWVDDNIAGCEVQGASNLILSVPRMKSPAKEENIAFQLVADVLLGRSTGGVRGLAYIPPSMSEPIEGDCGGTLTIDEDHANGNSDIRIAFSNYCSGDAGEQSTIDGTLNVAIKGEPGPTGPEVSSIAASTKGALTVVTPEETVSIELDDFRLTGDDTSGTVNIDRITISLENEGVTHSMSNVSADMYEDSAGNSVLDMHSGRYNAGDEGYVEISTPTPLTIDDDGELVSGEINFEGAEGNTVALTPSRDGIFDVTLNGEPVDQRMDCSEVSLGLLSF